MAPRTLKKPDPKNISADVPPHVRAKIEEAAAWRGVSVDSFVVEAAVACETVLVVHAMRHATRLSKPRG